MKYRNSSLAVVLLAVLLAVGAAALLSSAPEQPAEPAQTVTGTVLITEICTKNESVIPDNDGKYRDYVELYAPSQAVSLEGFTFTDGKRTSAPLGDITLQPGQYRVFFLSDETTGFALGASGGDSFQIRDGNGSIVAQATTAALAADQVMSLENGSYAVTDRATPGFSNDAQGAAAFREGFLQEKPQLVISELAVHNESLLPDEKGRYSDVVELHNAGDTPVDLGNYFLSDRKDSRFAYRLPDSVLEPGGYLVIYCDGENYLADGFIHANFGLSRGESVYLTDPTGGYLSRSGDEAGEDATCQLLEDGTWGVGPASLGWPNTQAGVQQATLARMNLDSPLMISEVLLSSSGVPYQGAVRDVVEIRNVSEQAVSTAGWFLSDGGDPYKYPLPGQSLQPGECLVLICDPSGTGFGLSQGEVLRLTGPDYRHALLLTCTEGDLGQSVSLTQGGEDAAYAFGPVSLGYGNDSAGCASFLRDQLPQGLQISEVMSRNSSFLLGPYGAASDWVELYNAGSERVDLSGYTLSDNPKYPQQYALPQTVLEPGEYCVVYLTNDPDRARSGYGVAPMPLSGSGDQLYLAQGGQILDFVILPELKEDQAYGRISGDAAFSYLAEPTPEKKNSEAAAVSSDPVAVTLPGIYEGVEYLDVELSGPGKLYYTTNCYNPTANSTPYTGPIRITDTTVLRVISIEPGKLPSQVVDLTYLLNEGNTLPVVSLVTEHGNLWGYTRGIYADGPNISPEYPHKGANFWQDWEVPATVSMYEGTGGFSESCGLKIFGHFSRGDIKKSFSCIFRDRYGASQLDYPLFGEGSLPYYEAFVLRAGGQDVFEALGRDEAITSVASQYLGLPVQQYKPVVLYLNGEYWGVYFIREKLNEQYVAGHYNVPAEQVAFGAGAGMDCPGYWDFRRYILDHDMGQSEHYEYVREHADLENYTDYIITQLWLGNNDSANVKYFTAPGIPWTWILYDTDMSCRSTLYNTFVHHLDNELIYGPWDSISITLAGKLLNQNPEYRDYFLKRTAWQVNNVWTAEHINAALDRVVSQLESSMTRDGMRWHRSIHTWRAHIQSVRYFAENRTPQFLEQLQKHFGLTRQQMIDYGFPVK